MRIGRGRPPYVTSDNRPRHLQVLQKKTTHVHVTAKARRLNQDSTSTQSRWSTMKAWSTTPGLGRDSSKNTLSAQENSRKTFLDINQSWCSWHWGFSFGMASVGFQSEIVRRYGNDLIWMGPFVCFRWQETINTTPNALCVWAVEWRLKTETPMP